MFDFIAVRRWFYLLSIVLVLPGLISLALPGGLKPSLDFTSGPLMVLRFANAVDQPLVRSAAPPSGHVEAAVPGGVEAVFRA